MSGANEILSHFPFKNLYSLGLQLSHSWETQTAPMNNRRAAVDIAGKRVISQDVLCSGGIQG